MCSETSIQKLIRNMKKKNVQNRRQVALDNLLKVKEPNDRQKAEIATLQGRLK